MDDFIATMFAAKIKANRTTRREGAIPSQEFMKEIQRGSFVSMDRNLTVATVDACDEDVLCLAIEPLKTTTVLSGCMCFGCSDTIINRINNGGTGVKESGINKLSFIIKIVLMRTR